MGLHAKAALKKKISFVDVEYNKDYEAKVIQRAEKKWKLKMNPHVMTKEEIQAQEDTIERDKSVKEVI
jgi:hypothetical protein